MSDILKFSPQATMTSREIADLVESRHDTVKLAIDRLAKRGAISNPSLAEYRDDLNRAASEYLIGKRDSYVIVAQLSPEFTARLVDRWQELEAGATPKIPQTLSEALRLAADQAEQIEQQAAALALAAPKVEFVDRYVDSTGAKGFRQVCKLLKVKEPEFRLFLEDKKIMYRLGNEWMPFANHLDTGRFEVKAGTAQSNGHAFNSARFTPKGITWVAGEYAKYQLEQGNT